MRFRRITAIVAAIVLLSGLSACSGSTTSQPDGRTSVSATPKSLRKSKTPKATQPKQQEEPESTATPPATTPTPAAMDCSTVARRYGAWQSSMIAVVNKDCSISQADASAPDTVISVLQPERGGSVTRSPDGTISWPLTDGKTATVYPVGVQVRFFKDFTQQPSDPTTGSPRLMIKDANGSLWNVYVA